MRAFIARANPEADPGFLYHIGLVTHRSRSNPTTPHIRFLFALTILTVFAAESSAQVLEFWSNGLKYQALTRGGLTIMYARLPMSIREFGVMQIAVSNGSADIWKIKPTDFVFEPEEGEPIRASSEGDVIYDLFRHAGRTEVVKLQSAYEQALYGNQHIRSSNGYEQRRLSAIALGDKGIKAAAAASALALVTHELESGESTDGAVFFSNSGRELGPGRLVAVINGHVFEFRTR